MKKRLFVGLAALAACMVAVSAYAQSATAYSSSAVGVIKKTLPAKAYSFLSIPLNGSDGGVVYFKDTPLVDLVGGSRILIWDPENNVWQQQTKGSRTGWDSDFLNSEIMPGQPLFVYSAASSDTEVIFSGAVPDEATLSVAIPVGYQTIANPYPVPMVWGDSDPAKNAGNGARAMLWDADANAWKIYTKSSRTGWSDFANTTINPGEGIFLSETGTTANPTGYVWQVEKPYSWPN